MENKWIRKCSECNNDIIYSDKWYYMDSIKRNRLCRRCSKSGKRHPQFGKKLSEIQRKRLLENCRNKYWLGKKLSNETKSKIRNKKLGIKLNISEEGRKKISERHKGNQYRKGMLHNEKSKIKMRESAVRKIKQIKGIICPNFNETACDYFQRLNMWNNWNGYYAKKTGEFYIKELGYWPDYYEPNENIIIEWDEPKHYKDGQLSDKDLKRMSRIKDLLKCRFFRVNSKINEIKEWLC